MKRFLKKFIAPILFVNGFIASAQESVTAPRERPFSHRFSLSSLAMHVSDPDWSQMWWVRNAVPAYQFTYKGWGLKGRFFVLGKTDIRTRKGLFKMTVDTRPVEYAGEDPGFIPWSNLVWARRYNTLDIVASREMLFKKRHTVRAGLGISYRDGVDYKYRYMDYKIVNGVGGVGELAYEYHFWKRLFVSAETSYRFYSGSTGLFSGGIGLGIELKH